MGGRPRLLAFVAAGAAGALGGAHPALADGVIRPCKPGTPAHKAATKALNELDGDIRRLAPGDDPAPLEKRLAALGEHACFRIVPDLSVEAKTGLALRTWWEDGGDAVAAGALALTAKEPLVWVAPDVRRALTRETAPGHRLAPLLCPAYDDACGRDTDGWRLRAQAAFERAARAGDHRHGIRETLADWKREREPTEADCNVYARRGSQHRQLTRYQHCLAATAARSLAFPIGRVKKPIEGWLVVSGRRGHYGFCDELRAYDLATGSMYRVASCSGLALVPDGSVDCHATDAARQTTRERGTVSLDEIREAAWMLLQLGELDENVLTRGFGQQLPPGIPLERDDGELEFGLSMGDIRGSSAETPLTWRVATATGDLGGGTITWPRDLNDDAEAYATELLDVAEHSFTPGCPPATPPVALTAQVKLTANRLDTDPQSLGAAGSLLLRAWRDLVGERCARP